MKIVIKGTKLKLDEQIKQYAQDKIITLVGKLTPQAVAVRIELELTTHHHRHGEIFRAEVNLDLPQKVLRAESFGETILTAIDEVEDKLRQDIIKYKEKLRDR
jgi:ribosomal subunit interface protein